MSVCHWLFLAEYQFVVRSIYLLGLLSVRIASFLIHILRTIAGWLFWQVPGSGLTPWHFFNLRFTVGTGFRRTIGVPTLRRARLAIRIVNAAYLAG